MKLEELRELVADTSPDDWHALGSGTTFLTGFAQGAELDQWRLWTDAHHGRASLRSNLDVGLAWGLPWETSASENFSEPWVKHFPDAKATASYADVLWRGQPVIREPYVTVDGGRYDLPLPDQTFVEITPSKDALMPLTITPWAYAVGRLVHELSGGGWEYDEGLRRAKIQIADPAEE